MAEQPLKCFDRPLMKDPLSDSILITPILYIASWANYLRTKVLLAGE